MNPLYSILPNYFTQTDKRGSIVGLLDTGVWREMNLITSEAGVTRGGHYHKATEECFVVLDGCIHVNFKRPCEGGKWEVVEKLFSEGDVFIIHPYVEHTFHVTERAVWINLLSEKMNIEAPDFHKY